MADKEIKKLTEDELLSLKNIKKHYSIVTEEFGSIQLQQISLDLRKKQAESYLDELKISESKLSKELVDKYGSGNIDISTGVIT